MHKQLFYLLTGIFSIISFTTLHAQPSFTDVLSKEYVLELGGEQQYVEVRYTSIDNPILLFIHGGPAWPQTPQLRYFNSELTKKYTLVIWEQRGAGKNYATNPKPKSLSLAQIVEDGHELTIWINNEFQRNKIFLAGYSWGSLVGVQLASKYPEDYFAYFGISQFVSMREGKKIGRNWLKIQAEKQQDSEALKQIDSLSHIKYYANEHERFFKQYKLLYEFGGAIYDKEAQAEITKAEKYYDDYKEYDWYGVWEASSRVLQKDLYRADLRKVRELQIPVVLFQGRHDWNVPSVLAEKWLKDLKAPFKKVIWFEKSGHGPLEEEPSQFNQSMIEVLGEIF